MPDITHLARIHASPERVYQALTTAEGIRNWWTRDAILDSRIGGAGEFGFFEHKIVTRVRIDELKPPARVVWRTTSPTAPGWQGTTIAFDLLLEDSATLISLEHRGFEQADEGYRRTKTGWAQYLLSLHRYLEAGKGRPHEQ
jgi:uncharacterized protein YndB with AHSA1/START domain